MTNLAETAKESASSNYNLANAIHRHGMASPDALAVAFEGRSLSYGQLAGQAVRVGHCLASHRAWKWRQGRPPRVGILASRSLDACVAVAGACWAGATYVPLGPKLPEARLLKMLSVCDLSAVIADEVGTRRLTQRLLASCPSLVMHAGRPPAPASGLVELIEMGSLPHAPLHEPAYVAAEHTAYIIFTSGTTGDPKGVMVRAGAVRSYVSAIAGLLGLRDSDRVLETCELGFDFSVHNMFATWEAGASLHILPAAAVMNAVKFARGCELTVWNSVPSLAAMLRQVNALSADSLARLRVTVFGGEQLPASTVAAWRHAAPDTEIFNLYGPTEATVFCMAQKVSRLLPSTTGRAVVAIGQPLARCEAAVVDPEGQPVIRGGTGELAIAGVQLASGYLDAPELTASRFPTFNGKRWYLTGDLATRDASGAFHCLGRLDNQIKVSGHRVELEEIEAHLRIATGADLAAAVAWPLVEGMARGIVGFVGMQKISPDQVISELRQGMPSYMIPHRVVAMETLPLNANGKIDRHALRRWLEAESP